MKAYPKYKDSGIDWLGEVPEHWGVKKLKYVVNVTMGQSPNSVDYTDNSEAMPFLQGNADFTEKYPIPRVFCDTANKIIAKDSILVSVRAPVGALNIADRDYGIGRGLCALGAKQELNIEYLWYLLHIIIQELHGIATGSTYDAVSIDNVSSLRALLPNQKEQQTIVAFLDRETARIDALIQKKERMIELLKEKRIALITQAVSKGLDPKAKMKDSGIEWLGEVPEHWEVKRLKFLSSCNDEALPDTTETDFEMLYVDIGSISRDKGIVHKEEFEFGDAPSRARRIVRDGDTIISTVRTYLRAIASIENPEDNLIVSTGFAVIRPTGLDAQYLSFMLKSHYAIESIVSRSVGVSYPAINAGDIGDIFILQPLLSEQQEIVRYLLQENKKMGAIEIITEHSISLLHEYRASLIHHAVSGKIDLRGYHAETH